MPHSVASRVCEGPRVTETASSTKSVAIQGLPVLPLRDVVVYPHMVIPLFVGREKSIHALDVAMKADKRGGRPISTWALASSAG